MIPLYGFLQGDTIGLLVLAGDEDTAADLVLKLVSAASVRTPGPRNPRVVFRGETLLPVASIARAGMTALDRFDVVEGAG
jgi:hypothetical protein